MWGRVWGVCLSVDRWVKHKRASQLAKTTNAKSRVRTCRASFTYGISTNPFPCVAHSLVPYALYRRHPGGRAKPSASATPAGARRASHGTSPTCPRSSVCFAPLAPDCESLECGRPGRRTRSPFLRRTHGARVVSSHRGRAAARRSPKYRRGCACAT